MTCHKLVLLLVTWAAYFSRGKGITRQHSVAKGEFESFKRNCGVASVGVTIKVIWLSDEGLTLETSAF